MSELQKTLLFNEQNLIDLKNFDFKNSTFFKMGLFRLDKSLNSPIQEKLAIYDSTLYNRAHLAQCRASAHESLSLRVHLARTLPLLPLPIAQGIHEMWSYFDQYIETHFGPVCINSFLLISLDEESIPRHRHHNTGSTFTFIVSLGKDPNNSHFVIGEESIAFAPAQVFAIYFDGQSKSHEVIKKDTNPYLYFIFDLSIPYSGHSPQYQFIVM